MNKRMEERERIDEGKKMKRLGHREMQFKTDSQSILKFLIIIGGPQRSKTSFQRGHCQQQRKKRNIFREKHTGFSLIF